MPLWRFTLFSILGARGEGAHLVDADGKRFMVGLHELAELAPRDVVAKAIHRVMRAAGTDHVFLDGGHGAGGGRGSAGA